MPNLMTGSISLVFGLALVGLAATDARADEDKHKQAALIGAELSTIATHLAASPESAIDFSDVSGQYCVNHGFSGGGHMTHYAIDPSATREDVIDFVNAKPLIEAGVNLESLPRLPDKLGKMEPNQWYLLPAGGYDPHHGTKFTRPMIVRASNL